MACGFNDNIKNDHHSLVITRGFPVNCHPFNKYCLLEWIEY